MPRSQAEEGLLEIIQEIAEGRYSDRIMELTKPEAPEFIRTVAEAMGLMMVKVEAREFRLEALVKELQEANRTIRKNSLATVTAMAQALGARDTYTEGHVDRVSRLAETMALDLGLDRGEAEFVRLGGLLHDIGKIGFPDSLFDDHGGKNPPELVKAIMAHPRLGAEILAGLEFLGPALDYVYCHHERLDGSGYPRRLKGEDIPLGAQILAVADSFDAMTTDRPYQKGWEIPKAVARLRELSPQKLNPRVLDSLARVLAEGDPR
ncbi:MAG: HD domain-containing protein [Deltaproteobacteria bacterium]|nr:HD domain-containing protein [Deltaproteobacteria bacterium]